MTPYVPESKKTEEVLKARAQQLAKGGQKESPEQKRVRIVEFKMANESYGIELDHMRMIHPLNNLTDLPGIPAFIKGIINVRGKIVSIVDLKKFFDLAEQEPAGRPQVIILSSEGMEFGILADRIIGIKEVPEGEIQASLPTLTGIRAKYLKGITTQGTVILDAVKLLTDPKMCVELEVIEKK